MVTVGGESGMTSESRIETYALSYGKWIAGENFLYVEGNPKLVLCDDLEGWDEEGCERVALEEGDVCIPMADSCWCMTETTTIL